MHEQAIIHCKPEYADQLFDIAGEHVLDMFIKDDEAHIIVDDVPYDPTINADPDVQLCDYYGIDWDQVNCIEAYEDQTSMLITQYSLRTMHWLTLTEALFLPLCATLGSMRDSHPSVVSLLSYDNHTNN